MPDIEKLMEKPPKEARDVFNGEEEISTRMIQDIEELNKDNKNKTKGAKKKIDVSIAREDADRKDYVLASAKDNMVYRLDDGTITHEVPVEEKERG